jgi:riboflavin synthase
MFSGIVEEAAEIVGIEKEQDNLHITMVCSFVNELKIDQSIAHNGVCLTVVRKTETTYTVTAIKETLLKSNLGRLQVGDRVNLERSMSLNGRLDGHIVQGHVDQTAECAAVEEADGSWYFTFKYDATKGNLTVEKGSIAVNGVSLTVVNSQDGAFQVAIIPYTYECTNFQHIRTGTVVNLEFDIIGKYVARILQNMGLKQ